MSKVFWDTNLFIYLIEGAGTPTDRTKVLRQWIIARGDELLTSALTLGELLVKPLESGNEELAFRYERTVREGATVLPFDEQAAIRFAEIRADRGIRSADAIQLACAAAAGVDLFVTNDERLSRKIVRGVQFIQSLDRATPLHS